MKTIKKIYCRSLQTILKIAIPILPYRTPETLNSVKEVPDVLHKEQIERVLLITDHGIRNANLTEALENYLKEAHISCTVYDETVANPTEQNVKDACKMYKTNRCQALIGFGGGSSIDCAKAVGAYLAQPKKTLSQMEGVLRVIHKIPLLIAVPTTAGTGSETTLAAVVTDSETKHKYPISDFCLIPRYAVLDPKVTRSLPPFITACTGMDALTHAVEAYIGRSTTKHTRKAALEAVHLIFTYLERCVQNGNDMEARQNMLHAAYLAGDAFSKSYVGYVHAVAHSLSGAYNIPHGLANAVLLPNVLEHYGSCIYEKLSQLANAAGLSEEGESPEKTAKRFIQAIRNMNKKFNIPKTIPELKEDDIPKLSKAADHEGNPLYPVPVLMDQKELTTLYQSILER